MISAFKSTLALCMILISLSQQVRESIKITDLPNLDNNDFYHGWISSSDEIESYLYYQLFSADGTSFDDPNKNLSQIPIVLYLEGGPADPSIEFMWASFGPLGINSNINVTGNNTPEDLKFTLFKRNLPWTKFAHVLTIDSPTNTGYSFSSPEIFLDNTADVIDHLVIFLGRFYEIYPQLLPNPLYVTGNSYGGHWAVYLPYFLHKEHNLILRNQKINLGGAFLMVPLVDVKLQYGSLIPDFYLAAGLTDPHSRKGLEEVHKQILEDVDSGKLVDGTHHFVEEIMVHLDMTPGDPLTSRIAAYNNRLNPVLLQFPLETLEFCVPTQTFFNISLPNVEAGRSLLKIPPSIKFLMMEYSRKKFDQGPDFVAQFAFALEYLLNQGLDVLILSAQDDNSFPVVGLINLVRSLNWKEAKQYKSATRHILKSRFDNHILGTFKKHKNLHFVTLYDAGHLVLQDRPEAVFEVLNRFVQNEWV